MSIYIRYTKDSIPDNAVVEILQSGVYAPSGKDRKPWRFCVIKDRDKIKQISKLTVYSRFAHQAAVLILLYITPTANYPIEKDILSAGACMQNLLLSATEKGYATCVVGELFGKDQEINRILGMDNSDYRLLCGVAMGKAIEPSKKERDINLSDFIINIFEEERKQ